jgi:exopolysaccharide production protein ExoQ
MKKLVILEKAFAILTLTLFTGAPLVVLLSGGSSQGDGIETDFLVINIIFLVVYCIAFSLLLLRRRQLLPLISQGWLIYLLTGFAALSIIWSATPVLTLSRVIALSGTVIFSLYFSSRYSIKEQLEIVGWTMGIGVITSLIFALALPEYGQMNGFHAGLWRGVYNHKNVLGKTMGLAAIVFLILALRKEPSKWISWGLFALSIFLLIMSSASSPLLNLIVVILAFFLFQIVRWQHYWMMLLLSGMSMFVVILYAEFNSNVDLVANVFNKDLTFSGRTDLWPLVLDKIQEQPWFGYGFGAFWNGLEGPSAYIWSAINFQAPNAHNGYLDLILELGIFGLSIYALQFFVCSVNALLYIRSHATSDGLWPGLLLLYIVLSNITESGLLIQNNIFLALQLSTFFSLGLEESKIPTRFFAK